MIAEGDGWELRLGDCLDPETGLASIDAVDHALMDPPYSEHVHNNVRSAKMRADDRGHLGSDVRRTVDLGFEPLRPDVRLAISRWCGEHVRGWVAVFSDYEGNPAWRDDLVGAGLKHWCVGHWRRLNGTPAFNGRGPANACEAIEIACKRSGWNGGGRHAFWAFPIVMKRGRVGRVHTTQKPLELMEALVLDFTQPGDLICDPFAGSGTTGIACVKHGRRFVGWERDAQFFDAARRRLEGRPAMVEGQRELFG